MSSSVFVQIQLDKSAHSLICMFSYSIIKNPIPKICRVSLESCSRNLSYLAKSWSPNDSCLKSVGKDQRREVNLFMHAVLLRSAKFSSTNTCLKRMERPASCVCCSALGVWRYTVRLSWMNALFERGGSCDTRGEKALSVQMSFVVRLDLMASCCSSHKLYYYFSLRVFTDQKILR